MKLIHTTSSPYTFNNPFVIGCTNSNDFFPLYATLEANRAMSISRDDELNNRLHTFSVRVDSDIDHYLYNKPFIKPMYGLIAQTERRTTEEDLIRNNRAFNHYRVFNSLLANFQTYRSISFYNFTVEGVVHSIQVGGGYLASQHDDKILFILAVKTADRKSKNGNLDYRELLDRDTGEIFSPSSFRLYVSTELLMNPIYKNLYKKLDKEIMNTLYQNKIDIMFTTSENIEKELFKNGLNLSFTDLDTMSNFLNNEVINNTLPVIDEQQVISVVNSKIEHILLYHDLLDDYTTSEDLNTLINIIRSKLDIDEIHEHIRLNFNIFRTAFNRLTPEELSSFNWPLSIRTRCILNLIRHEYISEYYDDSAINLSDEIMDNLDWDDLINLYNDNVNLRDHINNMRLAQEDSYDYDGDDDVF